MENLEFEQMKAQMAVLEKKIADQEIVNERLISESMKDKLSWIKKFIFGELILAPITVIIWLGISIFAHIPLWLTLIMAIGCAIDIYFDWKINITPIKENDFDRQNLIETAEKLHKMKRQRAIQTIAGTVSVIIFFVAVAIVVYLRNFKDANLFDNPSARDSALIGSCVGMVIGIIIGVICIYKIFKKMQRSNDKIIQQIEEISSEK